MLKVHWRNVDFEARVVRLDPHTTKSDEGRTLLFTDALERLVEVPGGGTRRLKAEGVICPWVFNRSNRKLKGKRIPPEGGSHTADRDGLASTKPRPVRHSAKRDGGSGDVGHSRSRSRSPPESQSLDFLRKVGDAARI